MEENSEQLLTRAESMIMQEVWKQPGLSVSALLKTIREKKEENYARSTLQTFLTCLSMKGLIAIQKGSRESFVEPLKNRKEYRRSLLKGLAGAWYEGEEKELLHDVLLLCRSISEE